MPKQTPVIWKHTLQNRKYLGLDKIKITTSRTDHFIKDYVLEGLKTTIGLITLERSKIIWNFYLQYWSKNDFEKKGEYHYFHWQKRVFYFTSYTIVFLQKNKWLFNIEGKKVKPSEITLEELAVNYNTERGIARNFMETIGVKGIKEEWQNQWTERQKKIYFTTYQKAKGYTDEDFEELERIKKRRLITKNQANKPLNNKTKEIIEGTDLQEVKESIEGFKEFIQNYPNSPYLKEAQKRLSKIKSKVGEVQEKAEIQRQVFFNLMSIQDFAAELAHVIKTSLMNISNRTKFIQKHLPDFVQKKLPNPRYEGLFKTYANDIVREMGNLDKVTDFILNYATVEDNLETFDVKEAIENVFDYNARSVLDENQINYEVVIERSLSIHYNRKAFEDIIENLISNSVKALDDIENKQIRCRGTVEAHKFVLYFSDNGCGIEEDRKEKIFDIYETSTRKQGGSGIGLFTVKTRLKSLNGDIEVVENEFESTGATFKITLPFKNRKK